MRNIPRMSVGILLSVILSLSLVSISAQTQRVQLNAGVNLISIEKRVGQNRLTEVFPDAPVGTLVFQFDNSTGWSAAQMYPTGWSHPHFQLQPDEGAVVVLPPGTGFETTLVGESPTNAPTIYRGFNLVSSSLVRERQPQSGDRIFWFEGPPNYLLRSADWDELGANWSAPVPSDPGTAVWLSSTASAVHPNGTFANDSTAVYFNNFVPAFGIDHKVVDLARCVPAMGMVQLNVRLNSGAREAVGDPVAIIATGPLAGYLDPTANLVRYVRVTPGASALISFKDESSGTSGESMPITVPVHLGSLPMFPWSVHGWWSGPVFRRQPEDAFVRPGTNAQFTAVFNDPHLIEMPASLDVPYQWQKRTANGAWIDLPGATNTTLRFEPIELSDAASYRLRATVGCEVSYSRIARVSFLGPMVAADSVDADKLRLTVNFPVESRAMLQTSSDFQAWRDEIELTNPTNQWKLEFTLKPGAMFYRVVELP